MDDFEKRSLEYHKREPKGKIATQITKPVSSQDDLSLAYSPGVAGPCREIARNELDAYHYTNKGNLVGVITNGSAVLGLGNIGALASKPVMEGKAMLFKKFANIDVFDIEVNAPTKEAFVETVAALEPTFGGINLEDIGAPDCFYIEEALSERMNIPVFHDDQHGTAIIASAALLNALEIVDKKMEDVKIVVNGGGAAAIACTDTFFELGLKKENCIMCDKEGVIYAERGKDLNPYKLRFATQSKVRTMPEALEGADIFLGCSVGNVLKVEDIMKMAANPIIFALANPTPEIDPNLVYKHRPDAIMATGRSDFPNQVNNVLGFPFIFRGALDVGAKKINTEMKIAAIEAIRNLAKMSVTDEVEKVYKRKYEFGRDYLIPKPVDSRVLLHVAPAVAKAAMDSGAARLKVDPKSYLQKMESILGQDRKILNEVRNRIELLNQKLHRKVRIAIPFGEDDRYLRAIHQIALNDDIELVCVGDKRKIMARAQALGFKKFEEEAEIVDPFCYEKREELRSLLFHKRGRKGLSKSGARYLSFNSNYFAALLVETGQCDGMITGLEEPYSEAVKPILHVIGAAKTLSGVYLVVADGKLYIFSDCTINMEPSSKVLHDIVISAYDVAQRFTHDPIRVAMLSFSSFGSVKSEDIERLRLTTDLVRTTHPEIVIDGEMQADVALDQELMDEEFPFCKLKGPANVLIFPNLHAANISYKLIKKMSPHAKVLGPILEGVKKPANVLQRTASIDEIIGMTYLTADTVRVKEASKDTRTKPGGS